MKWVLVLASLLSSLVSQSQSEKYWVFFTDKEGVEFNPHAYFDQKAIDRRQKLGIDLYDETDFPVNQNYLSQVSQIADSTCNHTRWFNAVAVMATPSQISEISTLPFVLETEIFPRENMQFTEIETDDYLTERERKMMEAQTGRMGRRDFAAHNINGKGIRIAILDGGFKGVDTHGMFHHIRSRNGILKTYDFIKNKEDVYLSLSHGTSVLSCIAGVYRNEYTLRKDTFGLATEAEFLLARTEKAIIEVFSEEENWLAAVEWADKNGADIINSSLGYTGQRYRYNDMNGDNALVSRAGNLAAKKGILVVNSAGNDGSSEWNFIGAPADADSVLAVGGLEPFTGIQTSFSSVGPSYDYRLKPNVTAIAHVMAAGDDYVSETQGTSFSSPLMAGFAACVWQLNPEWNNMQIFRALETGADLYPYFDYAHGYGVPIASNFLEPDLVQAKDTTFKWTIAAGEIEIVILDNSSVKRGREIKELSDEYPEQEGEFEDVKAPVDFEGYLFIHFRDEEGKVTHYKVLDMTSQEREVINIPYNTRSIMCSYEGYSELIKLNK